MVQSSVLPGGSSPESFVYKENKVLDWQGAAKIRRASKGKKHESGEHLWVWPDFMLFGVFPH
jgi:hypothetical protein